VIVIQSHELDPLPTASLEKVWSSTGTYNCSSASMYRHRSLHAKFSEIQLVTQHQLLNLNIFNDFNCADCAIGPRPFSFLARSR